MSLWVGHAADDARRHCDRRDALRSRTSRSTSRPGAFNFSLGFLIGLGAASRIGIYDYLGYYDVCYIGDEVDESRPRDSALDPDQHRRRGGDLHRHQPVDHRRRAVARVRARPTSTRESNFIVSIFMEKIYGSQVATIFTLLVLWTAFGSVFALLLGYSRIPYAAARDGYFFKVFGRLHRDEAVSRTSRCWCSVRISILACLFSLGTVIDALIVTRILVQFIGQVVGVMRLRRVASGDAAPVPDVAVPVPAAVALVGWMFVFVTTDIRVIGFGLGILAAGRRRASWSGRAAQVSGRSVPLLPREFSIARRLDAAAADPCRLAPEMVEMARDDAYTDPRPWPWCWRSRQARSAQSKAKAEHVPEIPYHSVPNFLKLPPNLYLGEGIGVATNSKGSRLRLHAQRRHAGCSSSTTTAPSSARSARASTDSSSRTPSASIATTTSGPSTRGRTWSSSSTPRDAS